MENKHEQVRCLWAKDELLIHYHDTEYGKSKKTDRAYFEKLCLEGFQAGLSWRTVLQKREALRCAFYDFEIKKCAALTDEYLWSLKENKDLIRNKAKIFSVRGNAQKTLLLLQDEDSFLSFLHKNNTAEKLHKALKHYGFSFAGPVICESFLQSTGFLPAHEPQCFLYSTQNFNQKD